MSKFAITPFADQVLLREVPASTMIGSIIIPDKHQAVLNQGEVLDKGPLCSEQIVVGQIVFFPLHSENRMTYKGQKLIVVSEGQVLGSIQEIPEVVETVGTEMTKAN